MKRFALAPVASALLVLAGMPAKAVTTWNWSFASATAGSASGTFTTADVTPTAGVTYSITGISGTYIPSTNIPLAITGLSGYGGADNTFQWDGSPTSSILVTFSGISFLTSSGDVNLFSGGTYVPPSVVISNFGQFGSNNITSTLSPLAPAPVPGPLPIIGAAAAFSWSRRLRSRISLADRSPV